MSQTTLMRRLAAINHSHYLSQKQTRCSCKQKQHPGLVLMDSTMDIQSDCQIMSVNTSGMAAGVSRSDKSVGPDMSLDFSAQSRFKVSPFVRGGKFTVQKGPRQSQHKTSAEEKNASCTLKQ